MTVQEMYASLQKHAKAKYTKGWDFIVECLDEKDFMRDCNDYDLDTWDAVMLHYTKRVELKNDRRRDVRRDAW